MTAPDYTDCRQPDGVTVGLIDALIAVGRVLRPRLTGPIPAAIAEALADLRDDEDLAAVLARMGAVIVRDTAPDPEADRDR